MARSVLQILAEEGPARSSRVVAALVEEGLTPEAARQRLSRATTPIRRFPVQLLPKREAFVYLEKDRNTERFWANLIRDLRASASVFAAAIDGITARGGFIRASQLAVVSGAPTLPQKGQVPVTLIAKRLIAASILKEVQDSEGELCYSLAPSLAYGDETGLRARDLAERVLLDGMREWARKIGLGSYNAIRIRGDAELKAIGPFEFDLAGPSYLLPLQGGAAMPGFVVADAFADGILTADQIQFFVRKARMLKATLPSIGVLSVLVAEGFTGEALTAGHAAGIMMATPRDLFGKRVGAAITSLVAVLKNAGAYVSSSSPERLQFLLDNLFDIEGRSRNLRGVLFELVAAYLARRSAMSIDMNVKARDPTTGRIAEIDIQQVTQQASEVTAIECKGKEPGGVLSLAEVETWLGKIAIVRAHYRAHPYFREARHRFELWTSGTIAADALALLTQEQTRRVKAPIAWKDGQAVLDLARAGKEKGIADALSQHFLEHPFAVVAKQLEAEAALPAIRAVENPASVVPASPLPAVSFSTAVTTAPAALREPARVAGVEPRPELKAAE
jgi:hypothetical protein